MTEQSSTRPGRPATPAIVSDVDAHTEPLVNLRPATVLDALRIAALSDVLGYPNAPAAIAERLQRLLPSDSDLILVATVPPDEVIGWVHANAQDLLDSGRRAEILGLVVDPAWQGRGAGRSLVEAVEAWARAKGLPTLAVRSNVVRAQSHPFYERLGFSRVKTQHSYRKPLQS